MYIEPAIEIQPEGFKLTTGIDDAIWFKFTAKTDKITDVFVQDIVDTTKFVPNFKLDGTSMPSWWDVSTKPLTGGNVELPNVRFMNVGYRTNANGTVTVYIMWHEV